MRIQQINWNLEQSTESTKENIYIEIRLDWYPHLYVTLKWEPTNYKQWIHKWNFHTTSITCCYCWVKWLNFVNIWLTEKCLKKIACVRVCASTTLLHLCIYLTACPFVWPAGSKSFKLKLTPMYIEQPKQKLENRFTTCTSIEWILHSNRLFPTLCTTTHTHIFTRSCCCCWSEL